MPNLPEFNGEVIEWSQTAVNLWRKCPELARRVWSGEVVDFPGPAALAGILAHAGVSAFIETEDAKQVRPAIDQKYEAEKKLGNPHIDEANFCELAIKLVKSWSDVWLAEHREFPRVLETEKLFKVELTPLHTLVGGIDVVHECGVIDWKFSDALHWGDEGNEYGGQSWKHQRYDIQPTFYLYALSLALDIPIEDLTFTYMVITKEGLKRVECRRNQASIKNLIRELDGITSVVRGSPDGPWPLHATDWHCNPRWCPNYSDCQGSDGPEPWLEVHKDKIHLTKESSWLPANPSLSKKKHSSLVTPSPR